MDAQALIDAVNKFLKNADISKLTGAGVLIVIFGLILLAFTFIVPILAIGAALLLIIGAVFVIYKLIEGK